MTWVLLTLFLFSLVSVIDPTVNNNDHLVSCVSKYSENVSGCSLSANCCSSLDALLSDLNYNCEVLSNVTKIVIEVKTDLEINKTLHFGKFCGYSLPLDIMGERSVLKCYNSYSSQNTLKNSGSGIYVESIDGFTLQNITFSNCGSLQSSTSFNVSTTDKPTTYLFPTTLYILNCSDVSLIDVTVRDGHGTGAALFDTVGSVNIVGCSFDNNRVSNSLFPGGGGLYIEFTNCTPGQLGMCYHSDSISTSYVIKNCSFHNNYASLVSQSNTSYVSTTSYFQGLGKGGGMAIYINGNKSRCIIHLYSCTFQNNSAVFGGGLFLQFRDNPSNNYISVENCNFTRNVCYVYGGGGACVGYVIHTTATNNSINFITSQFIGNSARGNGGGLSLFTTKGKSFSFGQTNKIHIEDCQWFKNSAFVASALDLAPEVYSRLGVGILPSPTIENCTFDSNFNRAVDISSSKKINASENGLATVYISGYQVQFKRNMIFKNNNGTGLYLSLATVSLSDGTKLHFENNRGKYGGGMNMAAFSVLIIDSNCKLTFVNNTSFTKGGAVLIQSIDSQHEASFSHSCFLQFKNVSSQHSFQCAFINNIAKSGVGNAIYATSYNSCEHQNFNPFQYFNNDIHAVAFPVTNFTFNEENLDKIIPGVEVNLGISAFDAQRIQQDVVYNAFMSNSSSSITIDPAYLQVSNNTIKFHGSSHGNFELLTLETERTSVTINISLGECPPGFQNDGKSCVCSITRSEGVAKCNETNSFIVRGNWIGLCSQHVCAARCPPGYCSYNGSQSELVKLPSTFDDLNDFLCHEHRTGLFCSKCKNGTSTFYHSHYYHCGPNKYCKFGVLFYLLSEIIPVGIVFIIVTMFNISLTSGAVNSFVLFAQISDSIDISARSSIVFPQEAKKLAHLYKLIYRIFNFDFFALESLSFCLWESATALDMMAVKYVTITFSLCLVLLTVFIMNSWKCKLFCVWFRPRTLRSALTHGFSTLVVICFSQCARVCFLILSTTVLSYTDREEIVVLYNGALRPFHNGHVQYAIPAIFFLVFLVFLPLLWLLLYPLSFKVLEKCHLNESKLSLSLSKLFPIGLIDSFQGCYKNNCRWFAGLYFLYRLMPLTFSAVRSSITFYALVSAQFIGMLMLHSVFQPYKQYTHNLIDSFIFANLLLVNLLSAYNYGIISSESHFSNELKSGVIYIQIVLMYLPLAYIFCYCVRKSYRKVKQRCLGYQNITSEYLDNSLPPLRNLADSSTNN